MYSMIVEFLQCCIYEIVRALYMFFLMIASIVFAGCFVEIVRWLTRD